MRGAPFIQSVVDIQSYWVWRGVGGVLMFLSHIVFAWNVWRMCFGPSAEAAPLAAEGPPYEQAVLIAGGSALVYAGLALLMGAAGIELSRSRPDRG